MLSLIATLDEKRGIGNLGKIPWQLPENDKRFDEITKGKAVIMGRHRFETIGKPLEGRKNIVVTQDSSFTAADIIIVNSIDDALEEAGNGEVFVIGGAQIFNLTIDLADKLYLTQVVGDFGCDSFFPDFTQFKNETFIGAGEEGGVRYKFLELTI